MKRTLTFKGREGRFDEPSFILAENDDLEIQVLFPDEIRVGRYRLVAKHGTNEKTFVLGDDKEIVLPAKWLKLGEDENVEFALVLLNVAETAVIKDDYMVEPLKVQHVDGVFVYTPIIQTILKYLKELKELYQKELNAKNEILDKLKEYVDNGAELPVNEL